MTVGAAVYVTLALAAALSFVVGRRRPDYQHVTAFLAVAALRSAARALLRLAVPALALPRVPASVPRLVLRLDQALYLAWPAAIVALALGACLSRRYWPALLAWSVALTTVICLALRRALTLELYTYAELAALAFAVGAIVQWSGRGKIPRLPQIALVFIVTFDGLALVATRGGDVVALWPSALACYLFLNVSLIAIQGGALCLRSK